MNDVNVFKELVDLKNRDHLSYENIGDAAGCVKSTVQKWFVKSHHVDERYLWGIANGVGDNRFKLAVLCYQTKLPSAMLNILSKYNSNSFSMLVGTQIEDADSDTAIVKLIRELSKPKPDELEIASCTNEMLDTGIMMILSAFETLNEYKIPIHKAVLERSYQGARG